MHYTVSYTSLASCLTGLFPEQVTTKTLLDYSIRVRCGLSKLSSDKLNCNECFVSH